MHARLPKHFVLEERLERYAAAIELEPERLAGRWAWACHPLRAGNPQARYREVRLDLGCGKGTFAAAEAARRPDVLFVAVDAEPVCIAYAAQKAMEARLPNLVVVPAIGSRVTALFAPGEVSRIHLNFPTPYPRKKDARLRLTSLERLVDYRRILATGAPVLLRTDSQPLRDFTLTQLELAGYDVLWSTDNARAALPTAPVSEYERMTVADGATVYALAATPSARQPATEQTASLSLADYLPDDLDAMDYIPRGMQGTVTNLRNRNKKRQATKC